MNQKHSLCKLATISYTKRKISHYLSIAPNQRLKLNKINCFFFLLNLIINKNKKFKSLINFFFKRLIKIRYNHKQNKHKSSGTVGTVPGNGANFLIAILPPVKQG